MTEFVIIGAIVLIVGGAAGGIYFVKKYKIKAGIEQRGKEKQHDRHKPDSS